MYVENKLLERELKFTEIYKQYRNEDKAIREAKVMESQLSTYFINPRESDIIVGRINRPHVVFSPCIEGDGLDKIAYGIDVSSCKQAIDTMRKNSAYDNDYIKECESMIEFWATENTNTKIRNKIPKEWGNTFAKDEYYEDNSVIHPLYRLAGANLDFNKLFKYGIKGLINKSFELRNNCNDESKDFYLGISNVLEAVRGVILRYADTIEQLKSQTTEVNKLETYEKIYNSLINISENPPNTLREAVQLAVIYLLSGRNVEIGRIDNYLGTFYKNDIDNGRITREEATKIIDNFFSIIEEERGRDTRVIIGGRGRTNEEACDIFADVVLDVCELRQLKCYPQISLRFYNGMNPSLYERSLDILSRGNTFPMLYNDDVNIPAVMRAMDVPRDVAEQYSFFGCGEFMLSCKSVAPPDTIYNIAKVIEVALHDGLNPANSNLTGIDVKITDETTYEELLDIIKANIDLYSGMSGKFQEILYDVCNEESSFLLMSCLMDGCLENGKALLDDGIYHLGGTVETYGNVTAYDSITAIKKVVFDDKKFTLTKLVEMLDVNFVGYERERKLLLNAPKFGNDDDYADDIAVHFHEYVCNSIRNQKNNTRLDSFLVVVINNNMNVGLGRFVGATPDGRLSGEYLSNGNSAYTGCDREGVTALMKSMNKMDPSIHACANQNIKLSQSMFSEHPEVTKSILKTFFDTGAQQINLSVVNQAELEDAMINPEKHENLIVRVGGFTARFIYLDPDTQRDVLMRTAY